VGQYVYMTAAHTVVGSDNQPRRGFIVKPAYHLPSATDPIRVDVFVDAAYTYDPNHVRGHDLAYLHAGSPHSNSAGVYASPILIRSNADTGGTSALCAADSQASDPFWINQTASWYNPTGADHLNGCFSSGPARVVVHYPNSVNGGNNTTDPHPYISQDVSLFGNSANGQYYELYHPTADGSPVIGMTNALAGR